MSCTNCYNGCGTPVPDACVKYTGPNIPLLGIETGDPLSLLQAEIVDKLTQYSTGLDIDLSAITIDCPFIQDLLGCCQDKTLVNLIQVLVNASCTLKELVDDLSAIVNAPFSFTTTCLTLPVSPTRDDILQALLVKVCAMDTLLTTVSSDYVKATQLNSLIGQYLSANTGSTQQSAKMVPFVAYEYYGPLSNFDGSGIGLAAAGFTKVYICNGSNGTPDKRGRVAVGATQNVPGGAMDAAVDPSLPANAGTNYILNQRFGSSFVALNVNQIPAHSHPVVDSGHTHNVSLFRNDSNGGNQVNTAYLNNDTGAIATTRTTDSSVTGIIIGTAGGGQPHDNRQPSIAANFIMYIP